MPFFKLIRRAKFFHQQDFVVEAPRKTVAKCVETIDVDRYKMVSSKADCDYWDSDDKDVVEITPEEAEKLFNSPTPPDDSENAWRERKQCATEVEAFLGQGNDELVQKIANALLKKLPFESAGDPIEGWPMKEEPEYCLEIRKNHAKLYGEDY